MPTLLTAVTRLSDETGQHLVTYYGDELLVIHVNTIKCLLENYLRLVITAVGFQPTSPQGVLFPKYSADAYSWETNTDRTLALHGLEKNSLTFLLLKWPTGYLRACGC